MPGRPTSRVTSWIDATLAALGEGFLRYWSRIERGYRRPFSAVAFRLKFAFYPMLALGACGWLAWDWTHDRSLNSAEDAIFDRVIQWRPIEPRPSGRVAVVEIDDCSIEYSGRVVKAAGPGPGSGTRTCSMNSIAPACARWPTTCCLQTPRRATRSATSHWRPWPAAAPDAPVRLHATAPGLRRRRVDVGLPGPGRVSAEASRRGSTRPWHCWSRTARRCLRAARS